MSQFNIKNSKESDDSKNVDILHCRWMAAHVLPSSDRGCDRLEEVEWDLVEIAHEDQCSPFASL